MKLANKRWPITKIGATALGLFVLFVHAWHYMPFLSDDALISMRYSKFLLAGHGLVWNIGERVEGYSNLLWVLLTAAIGVFHVDLVYAVRGLGVVFMGAAVVAVFFAIDHDDSPVLKYLVAFFLPLSAPFAVWTIGGMEQPLVAALLGWAIVLMLPHIEQPAHPRKFLLPGLLLAFLCLTRLDGPLFTAVAFSGLLIVGQPKRDAFRAACFLAALPVLFTLAQVAFRYGYYHDWIPNTARVKFVPSEKHGLDGWEYLRAGFIALFPLLIVTITSVVISFRRNIERKKILFLSLFLVGWAAYIVLIGGDIFPAWRHFVPLLLLMSLISVIGIREVVNTRFTYAASAMLLCAFVVLLFRDSENRRAISERWEWDGEVIGTLFKKGFGSKQALMAVDPAGCLPYWSELPTIDMLGLNDYYLPRHPPADLGQGAIGHELGDGNYVLSRKPDLVVFLLPTGNDQGYFLSGRQMQQNPEFFTQYTLVRFEGREPYKVISRVGVRKYSERIGITKDDQKVVVPGFLVNDNYTSSARLDSTNNFVVEVSGQIPGRLHKVALSAGIWRLDALATRQLRGKVRCASDQPATGKMIFDGMLPASFEVNSTTCQSVDIEVVPTEGVAELKELLITRQQLTP